MSLKLQWVVLWSQLPARWKPLVMVLALIAKDDGTSIWVRAEVLAGYLGLHRVTVSRLLRELDEAGIVRVVKHGGRWRTRNGGKIVGRATSRRLDVAAVEQFGRSRPATCSDDLVATRLLDDPDHVAAPLPDDADLVARRLRIKTGTYVKTGTTEERQGTKRGKSVCKTSPPAAPTPGAACPERLQAWLERKEEERA